MDHRQEDIFDRLIADAREVQDRARKSFGGLTTEQLNWKPSAEAWSIAQCLDHLMVSNRSYFEPFEDILAGERGSSLWRWLPWIPAQWGKLLRRVVAPKVTRKHKAPSAFRPAASDLDSQILASFDAQQERVVAYLERLRDERLGPVIMASPAIRWIVYSAEDACRIIVTHEQRHLQQAEAVAARAEFPE